MDISSESGGYQLHTNWPAPPRDRLARLKPLQGITIIIIIMILFWLREGARLSIIFRPGSHFVAIMWRQESLQLRLTAASSCFCFYFHFFVALRSSLFSLFSRSSHLSSASAPVRLPVVCCCSEDDDGGKSSSQILLCELSRAELSLS